MNSKEKEIIFSSSCPYREIKFMPWSNSYWICNQQQQQVGLFILSNLVSIQQVLADSLKHWPFIIVLQINTDLAASWVSDVIHVPHWSYYENWFSRVVFRKFVCRQFHHTLPIIWITKLLLARLTFILRGYEKVSYFYRCQLRAHW